jgi:hypothetical protein
MLARCNKSATLWKKVKTKRRQAIKLRQIDFTFVERERDFYPADTLNNLSFINFNDWPSYALGGQFTKHVSAHY